MGMAELQTVRIPELVPQSELSLEDLIPVFVSAENRTRQSTLAALYNLMNTGGGGSYEPVYLGGSIIYDVPADIEDGINTVSIPSLAGKNFRLRRSGKIMKPGTEYEILGAGGFKLKRLNDFLFPTERFELDIFDLQAGGNSGSGTGGGSSLITGVVPITTNMPLTVADHLNKLLQVRAGNPATAITITLFDLENPELPDNTIIPIETSINNSKQCRITTQGGQYIYMRNRNYTSLYVAPGEVLWLFKGEDGWYVINDFYQNYNRLGIPEATYLVGPNQLVCDGSLKQRAQYPRLWEAVQQFGGGVVSDATWLTASVTHAGRTVPKPYRGCFSTGDGSTTFRVPDLRNTAIRGLKTIGGSDPERYYNNQGGFQLNEYASHYHEGIEGDTASHGGASSALSGIFQWLVNTFSGAGHGSVSNSKTGSSGGAETRMDNIGLIYVINA